MGILKWIKEGFKFLIDDFKSDYQALKEIGRRVKHQEPVFNSAKLKEELSQLSFYNWLSDNWLFFLMLAFAFISGWWMASQHYQDVCNKYIIDHYIQPVTSNLMSNFSIMP